MHVASVSDSVVFWQRRDTLWSSGFMDDVTFVHNGAGIGDSKVTQRGVESWIQHRGACTQTDPPEGSSSGPGAESAIYDCRAAYVFSQRPVSLYRYRYCNSLSQ